MLRSRDPHTPLPAPPHPGESTPPPRLPSLLYRPLTHQHVSQQAGEGDAGEGVGREPQAEREGHEARVQGVAAERVHARGVEDAALRGDGPQREVPAQLQGAWGGGGVLSRGKCEGGGQGGASVVGGTRRGR